MPGFRIPGPLGTEFTPHIDGGTLMRALSLPPGPICLELLEETIRQKLRAGMYGGMRAGLLLARRIAQEELEDLGDQIEWQLEYIAGLPEAIKRDVAYEFFAGFFDDAIARKMLHHYVYGKGATMILTEAEMIACNPYINLARSSKFRDQVAATARNAGQTVPIEMNVLAGALTNGTLGGFTVEIKGAITQVDPAWSVTGTMSFKDTYDFDPRDFSTPGRSAQGEIKTRVGAAFIPGKAYQIVSVSTAFSQTQADDSVAWAGGKPRPSLDALAALDQKISEAE